MVHLRKNKKKEERETKILQLLTLECHFEKTRSSIWFCVQDLVSDVSFKQWKRVTTFVWLVHFRDFYIVSEGWLDPGHRLGMVADFINIFRTVVNCRRCHVCRKEKELLSCVTQNWKFLTCFGIDMGKRRRHCDPNMGTVLLAWFMGMCYGTIVLNETKNTWLLICHRSWPLNLKRRTDKLARKVLFFA